MPSRKRPHNPDLPTVKCPECRGTGARPGAMAQIATSRSVEHGIKLKCATCDGRGVVNVSTVVTS